MCEIVGTSQIVAQRREIMNLNEKLCSFKEGGFAHSQILAGSTRDGFRFDQSDVDVMFCCDDTRVIWDIFSFLILLNAKHYLTIQKVHQDMVCYKFWGSRRQNHRI